LLSEKEGYFSRKYALSSDGSCVYCVEVANQHHSFITRSMPISYANRLNVEFDGRIDMACGICDIHSPTIKREFPALLTNYMTETEWTEFCGKIDTALSPVGRSKKITYFSALLFLGAITTFAFIAMTLGNGWHVLFVGLVFIPLLLVPFIFGLKRVDIFNDIRIICTDISNSNSNINLSLKNKRLNARKKEKTVYIEIRVESTEVREFNTPNETKEIQDTAASKSSQEAIDKKAAKDAEAYVEKMDARLLELSKSTSKTTGEIV